MPDTQTPSRVTSNAATSPDEASRHFAAKLSLEADPADVWHDIKAGGAGFTLIDCRAPSAFAKAHLPGAINLPWAEMTEETVAALPEGLLVTYCWGPACNAATKGAWRLASLGREVKEMIGGFEYWVREGSPVEGRARGRLPYERDTTGLVLEQDG